MELFDCSAFSAFNTLLDYALSPPSIVVCKVGFIPFSTFIHLFHQSFKFLKSIDQIHVF